MSRNRFTRIDLTDIENLLNRFRVFQTASNTYSIPKNNHWLSLSMISACMFIRNQKERERGSEQIKKHEVETVCANANTKTCHVCSVIHSTLIFDLESSV